MAGDLGIGRLGLRVGAPLADNELALVDDDGLVLSHALEGRVLAQFKERRFSVFFR